MAAACLLLGCTSGSEDPTPSTTTAPRATTSTSQPPGEPLPIDGDRTGRYGGVALDVVSVEATNGRWRMVVRATSALETTSVDLGFVSSIGLRIGGVDHTPSDTNAPSEVGPAESVDLELIFDVDQGAELPRAVVSIAEPGLVPLEIPLVGEIPEDPYPVTAAVGQFATFQVDTDCGPALVQADVLAVESDVDLDLDVNVEGGRRARVGTRFVTVFMSLGQGAEVDCDISVDPASIMAFVDSAGDARDPDWIFPAGSPVVVEADRSATLGLGWELDVAETELTLELGGTAVAVAVPTAPE